MLSRRPLMVCVMTIAVSIGLAGCNILPHHQSKKHHRDHLSFRWYQKPGLSATERALADTVRGVGYYDSRVAFTQQRNPKLNAFVTPRAMVEYSSISTARRLVGTVEVALVSVKVSSATTATVTVCGNPEHEQVVFSDGIRGPADTKGEQGGQYRLVKVTPADDSVTGWKIDSDVGVYCDFKVPSDAQTFTGPPTG